MLEIFYEVAPTLLHGWLEHSLHVSYQTPDPGVSRLGAGLLITEGGLNLRSLQWQRRGYPQAVATYDLGGQLPLVYVDRHTDSRTLAGLAQTRFSGLRTQNADPGGANMRPACSAIVCEGAVSKALAFQHLWPEESRIFVQLKGSKSSIGFPCEPRELSTSLPVNPDGPAELGNPETIFNWVDDEPSMLMYRNRMAGKLLSLAEQHRLIRPTDAAAIWQEYGGVVKPAAEELANKGLVNRSQSGLSLAEPGGLAVARRSVANVRTVLSRYGLLDHEGGKLSRNERRHHRQFARMGMNWRSPGLHLELGDRMGFIAGASREVFPNGWVEIHGSEGNGVLHAVALDGPRPMLDSTPLRIRPYLDAQMDGQPQPLLLIFQTPAGEVRFLKEFPHLWALTTTVEEAMKGWHFDERAIWRYQGRRCDINHLLTAEPEQGTLGSHIRYRVKRFFGGNRR